MDASGKRVEHKCVRDAQDQGSLLLSYVLGGYGLFGVLYDVTMSVTENHSVQMETLQVSPADFVPIYRGILDTEDVVLKLSRIDITNFSWIAIYLFKRKGTQGSISDLPFKPREMSPLSRLFFKWAAGPLQELRFAAERQFGLALDWSPVAERNSLVYENATPVGRLYSPLLQFDDTFLLQEYFVPRDTFAHFYEALKATVLQHIQKETLITLLNTTIRYVKKERYSMLPYAREDSFAFVLYYRLRRTEEADQVMRKYHEVLADAAIRLGGKHQTSAASSYQKKKKKKNPLTTTLTPATTQERFTFHIAITTVTNS